MMIFQKKYIFYHFKILEKSSQISTKTIPIVSNYFFVNILP